MASPEAASVVARLREDLRISQRPMTDLVGNYLLDEDCDVIDAAFRIAERLPALLAVVEAAKTHKHTCVRIVDYAGDFGHCKFCDALAALYTPDSAEERSDSKDAEGAKP